jgi:ATP-dependent exoDNAse (exonuclease V) beta subunit
VERQRALDPSRSVLVQAPAGSGKTDLLTRRFLRLLAEVDEPGQILAITFTKAAAAEMRHRILAELEKAAERPSAASSDDEFSMEALASRALDQSHRLGWKLLDLPVQLRISTIDSFCRELALQQPLLSGLGGGIAIAEEPNELYRRAARQTLEKIGQADSALSGAIERLLLWRDNDWQELETLLVEMLAKRDRWMHDFVLDRAPDWERLRLKLERPFANAIRERLTEIDQLLEQLPDAREEALALARFACEQSGGRLHRDLAEVADFPCGPFLSSDELEDAQQAYACLADLLLTGTGAFRKQVDVRLGFPADRKVEKARFLSLIRDLSNIPGLEPALATAGKLPPIRYTDDDWQIVRAAFTLLRHAAAQLKVVFAEAAAVDFVEVSQIAESVLRGHDGLPTDAAIAVADGIRHLLVDEFQDTSRRQHQMLSALIAAWPDRAGRTCFLVGDPMQSIYFFRDADVELFERVKIRGLEIPDGEPLRFDFVSLSANFRTAPPLVRDFNDIFVQVFSVNDGSKMTFSPSTAARSVGPEIVVKPAQSSPANFKLHLSFEPQVMQGKASGIQTLAEKNAPRLAQAEEIVSLIQGHLEPLERARLAAKSQATGAHPAGGKYRIAVLGRTRGALVPVAQALRQAAIPFRALDLEKLSARPEVLDAFAIARALLNPYDRVAWLGVLRAPWCGLSLEDLHRLTSADDPSLLARPVPELLGERLSLLSLPGREACGRVLDALNSLPSLRGSFPATSAGTWLEQVWLRLGGVDCVDATARANISLLWSCIDTLPAGEQDLLGPALDASLDKLTGLPDPQADSDFGVQLMTVHKSKGLEFEVVIVPELQAGSGKSSKKLLAWLERGLESRQETEFDAELESEFEPELADPERAIPVGSAEITEFLVAPLQTKGAERSTAKAWVDGVYQQRESQETRRILYVAATRAREELHLFGRPTYKVEASGGLSLIEPSASLLATAWPALEADVHAQFAAWAATRDVAEEADIESIAASSENSLFVMSAAAPATPVPTFLRRLPANYELGVASLPRSLADGEGRHPSRSSNPISGAESRLYERHEGGPLARSLGTAVHSFLEELARLRKELDWAAARSALQRLGSGVAANIRSAGVDPDQASALYAQALQLALGASRDPVAQWILSPHIDAASEVRWTGIVAGQLRTVQVDRVFRAGLEPGSEGDQAWWIIDYKTAEATDPAAVTAMDLAKLRPLFAPQIEAYAQMLRNLHGPDAILRAGLYYPRMLLLDWWGL